MNYYIKEMKETYKKAVDQYLRTPPAERSELEPSLVEMEEALRSMGVDV